MDSTFVNMRNHGINVYTCVSTCVYPTVQCTCIYICLDIHAYTYTCMYFIPQTNQVNQGSSLNPDFTAARHILKFPFLHLFYNVDKVGPQGY